VKKRPFQEAPSRTNPPTSCSAQSDRRVWRRAAGSEKLSTSTQRAHPAPAAPRTAQRHQEAESSFEHLRISVAARPPWLVSSRHTLSSRQGCHARRRRIGCAALALCICFCTRPARSSRRIINRQGARSELPEARPTSMTCIRRVVPAPVPVPVPAPAACCPALPSSHHPRTARTVSARRWRAQSLHLCAICTICTICTSATPPSNQRPPSPSLPPAPSTGLAPRSR
jgi:hypothetical protein